MSKMIMIKRIGERIRLLEYSPRGTPLRGCIQFVRIGVLTMTSG